MREKDFFCTKITKLKILWIIFHKFRGYLSLAFIRKSNITFEHHKLLSRSQRDREVFDKFRGALAEVTKKCDLSNGEKEYIRGIFINNTKNHDIQRKLSTETKGISNHLKTTKPTKSQNHQSKSQCNSYVKREPAIDIGRENS